MGIVKAQRFPVSVHVHDDELVATAPGKLELALVGGLAERAGIELEWSAEELLVTAAAASYARTLAAVTERMNLDVRVLDVAAVGHVSVGESGEYGFVAIELTVTVDAESRTAERLDEAVELARRRARVLQALELPVRLRVRQPTLVA
jgi:organic hydroperoxide reductase OsmC/OhrA